MDLFKNYNDGGVIIRPGIYRHYKGQFYRVVRVVTCSETLKPMVLYQALYDNYDFWVRPLEMFSGDVEIDGKLMKRFTFINDQA